MGKFHQQWPDDIDKINEQLQAKAAETAGFDSMDMAFSASRALEHAEDFYQATKDWLEEYEVLGGIRRLNEKVHDIDIAVIPKDQFSLSSWIGVNSFNRKAEFHKNDIRFALPYRDDIRYRTVPIPVDLWICPNKEVFELTKLMRTGNANFNIKLVEEAHKQNMAVRFKAKEYDVITKRKVPRYGLYGAFQQWFEDKETGARWFKWRVNPLRKLASTEKEIIEMVFGRYYEPEERNF